MRFSKFKSGLVGGVFAVISLVCSLPMAPAFGAEGVNIFAGTELVKETGQFVVTKNNLNVRAAPRSNGEKLSQLQRGEVVQVIGKAKGAQWYAVQKDGQDLGFVYAPVLLRKIDGSLTEEIEGKVSGAGGVSCSYSIRFEAETEIEGELMFVADYWAKFDCEKKGKKFEFSALMFLTEMPYLPNKQGIFQIGVEIAEVGVDYDSALSATIMYHLKKKSVLFDGVRPKEFQARSPIQVIKVDGVEEAVEAAVKIAFSGWNDKLWQEVTKE